MHPIYRTTDGKEFSAEKFGGSAQAAKAEAKKHEAALKITQGPVNFLTVRVPELTPEEIEAIVAAIQEDPAEFRDAFMAFLRKPRKPRADVGVPRGRRSNPRVAAA